MCVSMCRLCLYPAALLWEDGLWKTAGEASMEVLQCPDRNSQRSTNPSKQTDIMTRTLHCVESRLKRAITDISFFSLRLCLRSCTAWTMQPHMHVSQPCHRRTTHLHLFTVTIQSIDAILVFLETQDDLATLKLGIQCFASAYPLVFRHAWVGVYALI